MVVRAVTSWLIKTLPKSLSWVVVSHSDSLQPEVKFQLGPVEGCPICCCFHQVTAALPYSCNSGWSAPSQVRWVNSVLCTALSPIRLVQQFVMPLLQNIGLLYHPFSRHMFLTPPLLNDSLTPCPTSVLQGWFSVPPHSHCQRLQFTVYISQFCSWGGLILPVIWTGLCFQGILGEVTCGVFCSPIGSTDLCWQL
jgi:hypothetical protein